MNDVDARNFIMQAAKGLDVPEALGDAWLNSWTNTELQQLATMSQAARQDYIAVRVTAFMDDPTFTAARVAEAAAQTINTDLQLQAQVAQAVGADLVGFNSDVLERRQSAFTGKVGYSVLTDIDVETTNAIIEVTTKATARGKLAQLQNLLGPVANPDGKPVLFFMPNARPSAVRVLQANGAYGVYTNLTDLLSALKSIT